MQRMVAFFQDSTVRDNTASQLEKVLATGEAHPPVKGRTVPQGPYIEYEDEIGMQSMICAGAGATCVKV